MYLYTTFFTSVKILLDFNQDYATVGFPLANNARHCGRRHDAVLSNDQMANLKRKIVVRFKCCKNDLHLNGKLFIEQALYKSAQSCKENP